MRLIELNQAEIAGQEAKLMVRMFPAPDDPFWNNLTNEESQKLLLDFNTIGEAIARASYGKSQTTLQDIAAITALNYYTFSLTKQFFSNNLEPFLYVAQSAMNDLKKARLTVSDYLWLKKFEIFDPGQIERAQLNPFIYSLTQSDSSALFKPDLQPLINMSQYTLMTVRVGESNSNLPLTMDSLKFAKSNFEVMMFSNSNWRSWVGSTYKTPLNWLAPEYATDVSQEITNRYLSEFCPLGCIRDNCPSYNEVDASEHRFHPLYMVHNFIDKFSERLIAGGSLHRDEVIDLMYLQQTNQNANKLWTDVHHGQHGFSTAKGFNAEDIKIQLMNTCTIFLEHSNFFKHPELRWLFETKILNNRAFAEFLSPNQYNEYKPFLISLLNGLKKEIMISSSGGDTDIAAYLVFITDELKEFIKNSEVDPTEKSDLLSILNIDSSSILLKWSQELIGKNDESQKDKQKMVFSLLLNNYHKKFCDNPNDPCFTNDKDLEIILSCMSRLESLAKVNGKIDPEVRDKYLTLRSWLVPFLKARIDQDKTPGDFVNKILFHLNPLVAAQKLKWDPSDFPTVKALDNKGEFYQFDLFSGQIILGKMRKEEIPENIKRDKTLQNLFGATLEGNWDVFGTKEQGESGLIAYTNDKFPDFRIIIKKGQGIGGRPKILVERMTNSSDGKTEWLSYVKFNEQDRFLSGR